MVSLNDFEKQILEMTSFYKSLPGRVNDKTDMFYAILARDSAEKIEELVVKYHNSPKNTYLHRLTLAIRNTMHPTERRQSPCRITGIPAKPSVSRTSGFVNCTRSASPIFLGVIRGSAARIRSTQGC